MWGNLVDGYGAEARRLKKRGIPWLSLHNRCDCCGPRKPGAALRWHAAAQCRGLGPMCVTPCPRRMPWWLACPAALAGTALATYGWAGLAFAVGQAAIR